MIGKKKGGGGVQNPANSFHHHNDLIIFILTLIFDKLNHIVDAQNCYSCLGCELQ